MILIKSAFQSRSYSRSRLFVKLAVIGGETEPSINFFFPSKLSLAGTEFEKSELTDIDNGMEEVRVTKRAGDSYSSYRQVIMDFDNSERAESRDASILVWGAVLGAAFALGAEASTGLLAGLLGITRSGKA